MEPRQVVNDVLLALGVVTFLLALILAFIVYRNRQELRRAERMRNLRILRNAKLANKEMKKLEKCEDARNLELAGMGRR